MTLTLSGIIPAIVTPYDHQGQVSPAVLGDLVQRLIGQGVGGLYVGGTTGEGPMQTLAERVAVVDATVRAAAGAVPVIAHIGTADTASSVALARQASDVGADAISAVVPYYYRHEVAEIRSHFIEIADASTVPFLPYYLSQAALVSSAVWIDLASHRNVYGFKFTSQNVFDLQELVAALGDRAVVFNGSDEICVYGVLAGAVGAIGSTYNFMANLFVDQLVALREGRTSDAVALQARANQVISFSAGINPVSFTRAVLQAQGLPVGPPRRPLSAVELSADHAQRIAQLISRSD